MNEKKVSQNLRVGYIVPEFPGHTHSFFWRELGVLRQLNVSPDVVSTRSPGSRSAEQEWAAEAQKITTYLARCSIRAFWTTMSGLWWAQPGSFSGMIHAFRSAASEEAHPGGRPALLLASIRQLVWIVMGARLAGLAHRNRWQHLHVHSCGNSAYIAMYANILTGLPYSLTLHGPLSDYGHSQPLKWRRAAFAIVITEVLRRDVDKALGSAVPETVEVSPMGVDVHEFARDEPYRPWSGTGPFRIFSCGRLNPSKGHDVLLLAVQGMVQSGADVQLAIAGEDENGGNGYRRDLELKISALGLNERVRLLGAVPAAFVRMELNRAHVFALASHAEPLGVAIMEAMSMGVPVVATASGGVAELVENKTSGLLVDPGSPEMLAQSMLEIMACPDLSLKLGDAGRRRVENSFDYKRSAKVLVRLVLAANAKEAKTTQTVKGSIVSNTLE
jgi:colanic acid/amylovoran biosynthesis glycosyltransferase